jgi:hypothetical protein
MALTIRRLGPGDEPLLARLAADDAAFDSAGRGEPLHAPDREAARRYFYRAGGFVLEEGQPVYMTRHLDKPAGQGP